jgi:hypothetical protein
MVPDKKPNDCYKMSSPSTKQAQLEELSAYPAVKEYVQTEKYNKVVSTVHREKLQ